MVVYPFLTRGLETIHVHLFFSLYALLAHTEIDTLSNGLPLNASGFYCVSALTTTCQHKEDKGKEVTRRKELAPSGFPQAEARSPSPY